MWRGAHRNPAIRSNLRHESGMPDCCPVCELRHFPSFRRDTDAERTPAADFPLQIIRCFTYLKSLVPFTPPGAFSPAML